MGKFDGVLIATDWDGTLFYHGKIPEENIKAIKYFQENGGLFTVCSGRFYDYLKSFSSIIDFNTYLICCNGALILKPNGEECLYEGHCDEYLFFIIEQLFYCGAPFDSIRFFVDGEEEVLEIKSQSDYEKLKPILQTSNIYKAVIIHSAEDNALFNKTMLEKNDTLRDYLAVRSWNVGLEIIKYSNSKGVAVRRVADAVGARILITAGDFENDIELVKAADIGYAVDNAVDSLKAVADRITVHCKYGAIAQIISDVEKDLNK